VFTGNVLFCILSFVPVPVKVPKKRLIFNNPERWTLLRGPAHQYCLGSRDQHQHAQVAT